ncbi:hypothetical protein [Cryptosporangium phraense]|uniref:ABC transporter substrate-binding protein n=1 Tax=Cryptosporangium phraense TaxID=2593070 RepID=A0A545AFQ6_9ACTN|nr:hypothetical protein [Cryptosporangium phraense]TQS40168.1 hypothetical protein FL583_36195 [Cryptosporangium phraense]
MQLARSKATAAALAAVLAVLMGGIALIGSPANAAPAAAEGTLTSTVAGAFTDAQGGQGTFAGTFTPNKFVESDGHAVAQGTLAGTLTDSTGAVVGTVSEPASFVVQSATSDGTQATTQAALASCSILDLVLGPLDLNLLGLTVHLNQVVLHIVAESGAGNLLGNLLCAVAGLLDGGPLAQLVATLNQILGLLGLLGL